MSPKFHIICYASEEIGQAISLSIFAKYADVLTCTGKCDLQIVSDAFKGEGVLIIQNPFCETWLNALIQAAKTTNKLVIFIHPYTEDLIIEPQSLFNYILPVFTDRMTDRTPTIDTPRAVSGGASLLFLPKIREWLGMEPTSCLAYKSCD